MKKIIYCLMFILLVTSVTAEVGQWINFTSVTSDTIIPTISSSSGGGSSGSSRNSNNCVTRVFAKNTNTLTCGEYSICHLPPHYKIVPYCTPPTTYREMPPPGTYNRGGNVFQNNTISKEPSEGTTIKKVENKTNVTITEHKKEDDKMNSFLLYGSLFFIIILLLLLGLLFYLLSKNKNKEPMVQDMSRPMTDLNLPNGGGSPKGSLPPPSSPSPTPQTFQNNNEGWRDF